MKYYWTYTLSNHPQSFQQITNEYNAFIVHNCTQRRGYISLQVISSYDIMSQCQEMYSACNITWNIIELIHKVIIYHHSNWLPMSIMLLYSITVLKRGGYISPQVISSYDIMSQCQVMHSAFNITWYIIQLIHKVIIQNHSNWFPMSIMLL